MSSNSTSAGTSSLLALSSSASPTIVSSVDPSSAAATSTPEPSETPIASSIASLTPSSSVPAPTSDQQSSTPVEIPSSTPPAASSTPPPSSSAAAVSSSAANVPTSVITASSLAPSTQIITQIVTPSATASGEVVTPSVIIVTVISTPTPAATVGGDATTSKSASSTETANAGLADPPSLGSSGGLKTGGKTAIAVVVPVVVVALLVLAGIIFWRKRKQRKTAEEARRKEVEEYGFNPNHDPTLPAVGMQSEMAEDQSGYRGWGNTTTGSNRKASTALNSGMTYSDSNSNPGGYQSPGSPTAGGSDGHSVDPLMNGRRETLDAEGIGALGAAPLASQNNAGVHRGPSNASSSYSAAGHSDNSGDYPLPANNQQDYYDNNAYYAHNPYDNNGYGNGGQPVIRDVSARRNTRIENPSVFPQQGNSGIAQNF